MANRCADLHSWRADSQAFNGALSGTILRALRADAQTNRVSDTRTHVVCANVWQAYLQARLADAEPDTVTLGQAYCATNACADLH